MSENQGKRTFVLRVTSQTSLFLSAVSTICSTNAMKCAEVQLFTVKTLLVLLKFIFEFMLRLDGALHKIISLPHDSPPF